MDETPAISLKNVTKRFPIPFRRKAVLAVDNLSLDVPVGQVYGLLGPNGSGKSTTFKVALGLVTPDSGDAFLFGKPSRDVASREEVGFLPENPYFHKFLTGAETLRFFCRLCGLSGAKLTSRVKDLLHLVGLDYAADRRLSGYSKGMLQRIGLAQALVQEPRIVILDEPTAGVDPAGSREIKNLIFQLKEDGKTVLLCSHLLTQVQEVCDRIGIMAAGRLVEEGALDDLIGLRDQIEIRVSGGQTELLQKIEALVTAEGGKVLSIGRPRTTLEDHFLEVTGALSERRSN